MHSDVRTTQEYHISNTPLLYLVLEHPGQWVHVHPLGNNVETKHVSVHAQSTHCLKLVLALVPKEIVRQLA